MSKLAAASNGKQAVAVQQFGKAIAIAKYAGFANSDWNDLSTKAEFDRLAALAAKKLGWVRDRRCNGGWRKVIA